MSDWDITLDGQGFMVMPDSYRASTAGEARIHRERSRIDDFSTGIGAGGLLSGTGAWHAPAGLAGVGPGPAARSIAGTISTAMPKLTASDTSYLFVVAGNVVYRWNRDVTSAPVNRQTLAANATSLVRLNDALFLAHGAAADIARYDDATNTLTPSALGAGVKATMIGTFSRGIVLVAPGFPMNLHYWYGNSLSYRRTWKLDGRILGFVQHDDALVVATDAGLHILSGSWHQDVDPPAPPETLRLSSWGTLSGQLQDSDDFAWMIVYQGRLIAWLGKRVMVYTSADSTWRPTGLDGESTFGAAVVNGWLLTTIAPRGSATRWQLWGYDGTGWWLLSDASGANTLDDPAGDGAGKLVTFDSGGGNLRAWDIDDRDSPQFLTSPFTFTTPPLTIGDGSRDTRWTRVGIDLARPGVTTIGEWSYELEVSGDGGATWLAAGSTPVSDAIASISLPVDLDSRTLLVRITGTRITTSGPPALITAVWAEGEQQTLPPRRWQLAIHARDRTINRAGAADPRSGQEIREALWTLWRDGSAIPFQDVDDAANPTTRTVRIVAIREDWPRTANAIAPGADTTIEIVLRDS